MRNKKIQLGSMEISLLAGLEHDNKTTFTFEGAFSKLSTKRQVVRNVLSRLNRKGRINRIRKGLYMLVPFKSQTWSQNELSLVPLLAKGGYVSFWSALSFWSLTEQLPKTVYVATGFSQKQREFEAVSFKFVHLASRYLFGEIEVKINGIAVKMASKEKAILDCLLHPEYCGGIGEPAKAIKDNWEDLNWHKIKRFLKNMGNSAVERRLSYILDYFNLIGPRRVLGKKKFAGFRLLDPTKGNSGGLDKDFGLRINLDLSSEIL